jgi:hypothetical protein
MKNLRLIIVVTAVIGVVLVYSFALTGKPCGGFVANLPEYQCPPGYFCKVDSNYPDAGGTCHFSVIHLLGVIRHEHLK